MKTNTVQTMHQSIVFKQTVSNLVPSLCPVNQCGFMRVIFKQTKNSSIVVVLSLLFLCLLLFWGVGGGEREERKRR